MRAAAASEIAVAWGTPTPITPRVVHAFPGPTPTSTPTAPVRIRCSAVEYDAHPPTITGRSKRAMNSFRLRGSVFVETCSADTTVPWITRMSSPASSTSGAYFFTRCGVIDAHEVTPPSLIWAISRSEEHTSELQSPYDLVC